MIVRSRSSSSPAAAAWRGPAARLLGSRVDDEVWDRVVDLLREEEGAERVGLSLLRRCARLRADVSAGRTRLLVVTDGPRLLAFAPVPTRSSRGGARTALRQAHVRPGAPGAALAALLVEAALQAAASGGDAGPSRAA